MVKPIVSILIVVLLLTGGAVYESDFISRQFKEFDDALTELYDKVEDETAVKEDVLSVKENWLNKKRYLHAFIPHNEIKEVDLWIFEAVTLVDKKMWEDALSKIEVLKGLSKEIPKNFAVSLENIL